MGRKGYHGIRKFVVFCRLNRGSVVTRKFRARDEESLKQLVNGIEGLTFLCCYEEKKTVKQSKRHQRRQKKKEEDYYSYYDDINAFGMSASDLPDHDSWKAAYSLL